MSAASHADAEARAMVARSIARGAIDGAAQFQGGRVLVSRAAVGWDVTHEPAAGGSFAVHWARHRTEAVQAGERRGKQYGARLFVEQGTGKGSAEIRAALAQATGGI